MMSAIVKLVQGSPEWHAHRAQYRNASETAIVMGESPWQTPYQLWELRTGRRQPEVNAAMARGTALVLPFWAAGLGSVVVAILVWRAIARGFAGISR